MNLKLIDAALAGYEDMLDEADRARLAFFRDIWSVQAEIAAEHVGVAHIVPKAQDLRAWSEEGVAVLHRAPVSIGAPVLVDAIVRIVAVMVDKGAFVSEVRDSLGSIPWKSLVEGSPLEVAGSNPSAYVEAFARKLSNEGADVAVVPVAASAVSLALRALIEDAAQALQGARESAVAGIANPVECPVCGASATVARVGASKGSEGRGKTLWCGQCSTVWDFERVRCARCGTRNQGHLHYFNIEGDDAHRIATCDECGGYVRTVYQDDALAPFSFEVEDVVMARLDLIAARRLAEQGDAR